ncbi:tricalbin-3 [Macadamia integrifolia]|uniref:tricalbin-3 n=1 Tax=Macadamia integrifolia TaxID=60698 RepID=UPI001C4E4DF0|nr:tricalbin-3 [Macadamia integrifolia]
MILQSAVSQICWVSPSVCPCKIDRVRGGSGKGRNSRLNGCSGKGVFVKVVSNGGFGRKWMSRACLLPGDSGNPNLNFEFRNSARKGVKSLVAKQLSDELEQGQLEQEPMQMASNFTGFQEDPLVDKLRTQLGVIHPIPAPPINRNVAGLFVFFFFVGVVFDKVWTSRRRDKSGRNSQPGTWPQVPTSFSLFLEKDLQRKESVEWVNMVLGKLWKVYRAGIENWLIGLLQPVIDNLKKPDYVERVEIKQFSLGEEPLSVRNVERRTSRRVNDLQYQIGLRYTGGARMLLMLSLKFGVVPITVPVRVRDFDIDGELWVKLRLIPSEPWVGAVSWAFVSLPKIKFELSPFRLFNLMAIPVLSMFLTKLLTEDLPRLFVRPKKIVLDIQKGKAVGPIPNYFRTGEIQEGNKDFVGELSVTLVDAQKLAYVFFGKTDPYVVLSLGDQLIRSKKNSQTTVIGPPGEPIWNQDFHMLVANPRKQKLYIQVKDSLGFTDLTIGTGEVELGSLQDTVPTDRIVALQGGWGVFRRGSSGEILLRLTYKAYVEDEEDDGTEAESIDTDASDDEMSDTDEADVSSERRQWESLEGMEKEPFMDVLAALLVSEEFQGIVSSETGNPKLYENATNPELIASRSGGRTANSDGGSGSALVWLTVITSVAVLIAINVGGSSFFNP